MVSDRTRRAEACKLLRLMCVSGGRIVEGRSRPSGRKSRALQVTLNAPSRRRGFARRDAERQFVMWLQVAYLEATGRRPPRTARHAGPNRKVIRKVGGPFVRMVIECLRLVGAPHADAVELIKDLERQRRQSDARRACRETSPPT
jgi:hypothetical protein